jgi:pimeloyl-ACP methyl ester carboxylesterase
MAELGQIKTAPGLVFDVLSEGPEDGDLVLLLHGFAESFHMWRSQLAALAAAGYRAMAPSQRGYSPGARPDAAEPMNYQFAVGRPASYQTMLLSAYFRA